MFSNFQPWEPSWGRRLAAAGCQTGWMGAESGSQQILEAMDKGGKVSKTYTATALRRAQGRQGRVSLHIGSRGATWDDIQLTLKLGPECRPEGMGNQVY